MEKEGIVRLMPQGPALGSFASLGKMEGKLSIILISVINLRVLIYLVCFVSKIQLLFPECFIN